MRIVRARFARAGVLGLTVLLIAAACSPAGGGTEEAGSGTFVVARTGEVEQLDPATAAAAPTVHTLGLVYDTLLDTSDEGRIVPGLAREWKLSDGGTTVTFTLRQGVAFHEGATFTAKDAKASLERLREATTNPAIRRHLHNISRIDAPSAHTLVLHLKDPDTALLTVLTRVAASMLDAGDIEAGTVASDPNGTGPFRWVSWEEGRRVTLAANASYWGGAPKLSKVALRAVAGERSVLSGVKDGSFDLGVVSDPGVVRDVDGDAVRVMEQATLSSHALLLGSRSGPLRKVAVRQAIACAIDRDQVVETAYFGHGKVTGPITSPAYDYDPTAGLPCQPPDRHKAEALLRAAGYAGGFTLETLVPSRGGATDVAQSLQAQLEKIGVRLRLKQRETDNSLRNRSEEDFEAAVGRLDGSYDPYLTYHRFLTGAESSTEPAGISSEKLSDLLREANSTTDKDERRRIFRKLQRELLRLSPRAWLLRTPVFYLAGEDVRGFEPSPTRSLEHLQSTRLIESES